MTKQSVPLERLAVRLLFGICVGYSALIALQVGLDLRITGASLSDLHMTDHEAQALCTTVSRAFNNLTAMVLTFIALAVPLTANMYTPKLIEIFVRDKVNITAMVFYAAMGAQAIWAQAMMFDQWSPPVLYWCVSVSGVVGFAVLIPYYFYVLAFLNPTTIIRRVTDLLLYEFDAIAAAVRPAQEARRRLDQKILNLGNVILRAVDRADRDVSLDAINSLQHAVVRYVDVKPRLRADWFDVEPTLFTGQSPDAVALVVKDRVWVEQKCLHQLLLAYSASLAKMPDAISAISSVNRRVALHAQGVGDDRLLALCVRYFNTFLREAIKKKDIHAIYDVYSQYLFLAREVLAKHPDVSLAIGRHFQYYAEFAKWQGMPFVYELAAYDVVALVESAYDAGAATSAGLLDLFLTFETDKVSVRLTKSQASLAAYFRGRGLASEEKLAADAIQRATDVQVDRARRELLATTDPVFWEVTDRQRNLDFVEPKRRAVVKQILDEAAARKRDGPAAT